MAEDKWYKIVNDDMDDIPMRVEQTKAEYWQKAWIFMVCTIIGAAIMGFAKATGLIAVGCFLAVTGMVGVFALATMSHMQLCLYRAIKEIRKSKDDSVAA
ncbi:MAG TPA: hypothetical protein HPP77_03215 [Candidatus Hydrogenedentes bacterium]|nr:hypothetical protein [Candidatus Hydrogenedentota bacterium]